MLTTVPLSTVTVALRLAERASISVAAFLAVAASVVFPTTGAYGQWSISAAYHNPPGAVVGANIMKLWTNYFLNH